MTDEEAEVLRVSALLTALRPHLNGWRPDPAVARTYDTLLIILEASCERLLKSEWRSG